MDSKTPVQFLNEYCFKKKSKLEFTTIHDETGTHKPTYIIRAEAFDKHATGEGNTKKLARQEAAKKLIEILKIPPDGKVVDEKAEASDVPGETKNMNFINRLDVYCLKRKHPKPQYADLETKGPDHDKSFVVQCSVSEFHEIGEAKQVKRARHTAASKMLKRLETQDNENTSSIENRNEVSSSSLEATNEYSAKSQASNGTSGSSEATTAASMDPIDIEANKVIKRLPGVKHPKDPKSDPYKDQYQALVGIHENSLTLKKLIDGEIKIEIESAVSLLKTIAEDLKIDLKLKEFNCKDKNILYSWKLSTNPEITGVGRNEKKAADNLLKTLIDLSAP